VSGTFHSFYLCLSPIFSCWCLYHCHLLSHLFHHPFNPIHSLSRYLLAKAMVELPLDALLSSSFAFLLHKRCALRQSAPRLASTLALLAVASSSLGFAVGACTPSPETVGDGLLLTCFDLSD
jgi:hypothetical protein